MRAARLALRLAALLALAAAIAGVAAVVGRALPDAPPGAISDGQLAAPGGGVAGAPAPHAGVTWSVIGRSVRGRPIRAARLESARPGPVTLVVGCIHGDECAGIPIAWRLVAAGPPARGTIWVIPNLNPDGRRIGWRLDARGVDLNRNFASGWRPRGSAGDPEYPGPRPFSEPETRAVRALVRRLRPRTTIWYHQPLALVRAWGGSVRAARRYAALAGLPFRRMHWLAGTAPNWQNHRWPGSASFVVELPPGRLAAAALRRHVRAVRALALGW